MTTTNLSDSLKKSQLANSEEALIPIKRALLSVYDKTNLVTLGTFLMNRGIECFSSTGSYRILHEAGLPVKSVESLTQTGELFGGRVKTLHPAIHGGILMNRDNPTHLAEAEHHHITPFDLIVINLYPFEKISQKTSDAAEPPLAEALEMIDIGGPTLLRAAAKNFPHVTVLSNPHDYARVITAIEETGGTTRVLRAELALKAFQQTAHYDNVIAKRLESKLFHKSFTALETPKEKREPDTILTSLRYGENPHQAGWLELSKPEEREAFSIGNAKRLRGAPLSYNNILDAEAAIRIVRDVHQTLKPQFPATSVIIKHSTPCGLAVAKNLQTAMEAALAGDIVSRYGSVIAVSQILDLGTAQALKQIFVEMIVAPGYTEEALTVLTQKNKRMRLLLLPQLLAKRKFPNRPKRHLLESATLVQAHDEDLVESLTRVTEPYASQSLPNENLFHFANLAVKHTKSNAITLAGPYQNMETGYMLLGLGAGQPNRFDAIKKLAIPKMEENLARLYPNEADRTAVRKQIVLASDAFFPFPDSLEPIADHNISYIIQPGGSIRDKEVIAEANSKGLSMIFTHRRHFLH